MVEKVGRLHVYSLYTLVNKFIFSMSERFYYVKSLFESHIVADGLQLLRGDIWADFEDLIYRYSNRK